MDWLGVERRRLANALLGFGIVGLVLAAIVALALLAGAIAARDLDARIVAGQDRIAAALTRLTLTMDSVASSVDHAGTTLSTSRDSVAHAGTVLGDVAATSDSLASALDIDLFGSRPFTASVSRLHDLSTQVRVSQDDAARLAANLDQDQLDATQIASEVRDMRSQVGDLAGSVTGLVSARDVVSFALGGILLAGLLTVWTGVLAAGIAWAGWRLRQTTAAPAEDAAVLPEDSADSAAGPA